MTPCLPRYCESAMNVLLLSMPDSFEHMPTVAIRMPNGALASLAGNVDSHHHVAIADLVLVQAHVKATIERLMRDVELDLTIELGRTHMHLEDVLKLKQGAVVALDKLAGDPADIYVNGRLIARGEVLVLNDNFCVRVAELIVGESACA